MSIELKETDITSLALTPGFLRSEAMLEYFGVSEDNWRDGVKKDMHFAESETPYFVGRAVVALAADSDVSSKSGKSFSSWRLANEYGFKDMDGSQPDFGGYIHDLIFKLLSSVIEKNRQSIVSDSDDSDSTLKNIKALVNSELQKVNLTELFLRNSDALYADLLSDAFDGNDADIELLTSKYFDMG